MAELLLLDLWAHMQVSGTAEHPFIVSVDEFQKLRFSADAPASLLLTEGRKYGCGFWLATQFLRERFDIETRACLEQASAHLIFSPPGADLPMLSKQLTARSGHPATKWKELLCRLPTGVCIASLTGQLARPVICCVPAASPLGKA